MRWVVFCLFIVSLSKIALTPHPRQPMPSARIRSFLLLFSFYAKSQQLLYDTWVTIRVALLLSLYVALICGNLLHNFSKPCCHKFALSSAIAKVVTTSESQSPQSLICGNVVKWQKCVSAKVCACASKFACIACRYSQRAMYLIIRAPAQLLYA